ncbi:MAG: hypothetical protein IH944_09575 [Armatimonadetes bacterium]|nr:hypothetical protein [Armatimonadota bacterium]
MRLLVNGTPHDLVVRDDVRVSREGDRLIVESPEGTSTALAIRSGDRTYISYRGRQFVVGKAQRTRSRAVGPGDGEIRASMPGLVVQVLLESGAEVAMGDRILVIEAMKTQLPIVAPLTGVVESVRVKVGQQVTEEQVLAIIVE